jgi:AAA15 family ATPase/GTPase
MNMITLKGFKSYEDETLNNLHPRINIVLGRNGEGKSNFFKGTFFPNQPSISYSLIASPAIAMSSTHTPMYHLRYAASPG